MKLAMTADQISNSLDYFWESQDIEADADAAFQEDLDAEQAHLDAHEAGSATLAYREDCDACKEDGRLTKAQILAKMDEDQRAFEDQIHNGYRIRDLYAAFDRVKNPKNWKEPIIAGCGAHEKDIVREAIIFITGSVPTFHHLYGNVWSVQAPGYYSAVGA